MSIVSTSMATKAAATTTLLEAVALPSSTKARVKTRVETGVKTYAPASTTVAKVSAIARSSCSHGLALTNHVRERTEMWRRG